MNRTLLGAVLAAASISFAACDSPTASRRASVTIAFSSAPSAAAPAPSGAPAPVRSLAAAEDIILEGTNGTLTITSVGFIVSEFKLERDADSCESGGEASGGCERFETGLAFVDLPLDGTTVPVVTQSVPEGTYVALKFEVKDAGPPGSGANPNVAALIEEIEAAGFTNWPEEASLVVVGSFTPAGGEPQNFTAFFDAEIKVVLDIDPSLVIEDEAGTVDIEISPMAWFTNLDGTVTDLSALDYAATGEVSRFESKFENGLSKIELEGFDD